MNEASVTVSVVRVGRRPNYVFRWIDPATGRRRERQSTIAAKASLRGVAEREAALLEDELNRTVALTGEPCWGLFRERYRREHLSGLEDKTRKLWRTVVNHVERILQPTLVTDVDASAISRMVEQWRQEGVSESSIASYLRTLKAGLNWAAAVDYIPAAPKIRAPKKSRGMDRTKRGRPLTRTEFARLLRVIRRTRRVQRREWGRLLRGLFWSGLRLGEALTLTWDWSTGSDLAVDMNAEYPVYRIFAAGEKGAQDRILPIAPEFVRMLRRVPLDQRHGLVFGLNVTVVTAGRTISTACRLAGIVVDRDQSNATAHDLRRSFGSRWASRVTPAELQVLMRHKSIETTMKYYVELDAISLGHRLASQVARPSGGALGGAALIKEKDQIVKERRKTLSSKS